MSPQTAARWVAIAAAVETGTGLLLIVRPSLFTWLLFGATLPPAGQALGRLAAFALFGLALACWPRAEQRNGLTKPVIALLSFSLLTALYLIYLAVFRGMSGLLLWPAVVLHLVLAVLLARIRIARIH